MDEDAPHQMRWPRVVARVAGYAVLAVVLYVLSAGPAIYLFGGRAWRVERAANALYSPLCWLADHIGFVESLSPYYYWWSCLPGGPEEDISWLSPLLPAWPEPIPEAPVE